MRWSCTYCSPINEKVVEVHEHASGLFGVGLLVDVSIEVAQLQTDEVRKLPARRRDVREKQGSYHRSGVELGDDVVEEGGEVGGARLQLLDAVEAVTLAVRLEHNQHNILKFLAVEASR